MKTGLWDVTPYCVVDIYRLFTEMSIFNLHGTGENFWGGKFCPHHHGRKFTFWPENGGSIFPRNIGKCLPDYTVTQ
jgi:hypothetical protein